MKNPLIKRIPRELKADWKKYIALFLLFTIIIGSVSGMFVAGDSMSITFEESYEKYNIEHGHFELKFKASDKLIKKMEKRDIVICEQFYKNVSEDNDNDGKEDGIVRIFINREKMNKLCVLKGDLPEKADEIAIDRMHADNAGLTVGNDITVGGRKFRITGLVAFSDYSTLFENNTDIMFNSITFNVAVLTKEGYESVEGDEKYQYAFQYQQDFADDIEQKELSDKLVSKLATDALLSINEMTDFVPEYANSAIHFAPDDFGKDKVMCEVLLLIFTVVLAFIFAITTSNKIFQESTVIGTLRSMGYSRSEIMLHYISTPIIITIISAICGNILGYTLFKDVVASMYYNSYSLPTYTTVFNGHAFVETTVYPLILMAVINFAIIAGKLRFSPLRFLRKDISRSKNKSAVKLPPLGFTHRFRLRILLQNVSGYLTLVLGIYFVMVLLAFSIGMPATLDSYKSRANEYSVADYQYILKQSLDAQGNPVDSGYDKAEPVSVSSLKTVGGVREGEEITVYGYFPESRYFDVSEYAPIENGSMDIYVSEAFAEKFSLEKGENIALGEKYSTKVRNFRIADIYDLPGTLAILMPNDNFNEIFGFSKGSFTAYLSDKELTGLDKKNILMTVTVQDTMKMIDQLDHSMGDYMDYFSVACMVIVLKIS